MRYLRLACATVGVFIGATTAWADSYQLAYSKADNIQIYADHAPNANWCAPHVTLRAVYLGQKNQTALEQLFPKIGVLLSRQCPQAVQAQWTSTTAAGQSVAQGTSDKDHGWVMTATAAPAAAAPAPTTAPVSAAASVAPAPAASAPAAAAPATVPPELSYNSMLLRLVHDTPDLLNDDSVLRYWANYRFGREYQAVANQDFKVRPVLAKAKDDLQQTVAQTDTNYVALPIGAQFGNYDFSKHLFPLNISTNSLQYGQNCCTYSKKLPSAMVIKIDGLDAIAGISMPKGEAQAFVQQRTRYGNVDRSITVIAEVKLTGGFQATGWGSDQASGVLDRVLFVTQGNSQHPSQIIGQLTPDALAAMREAKAAEKAAAEKAAAEKQAAQRRQQLLAQRDTYIQNLARMPMSTRMANFMTTGQISYNARLDNLRAARGRALFSEKPASVIMLVQADGNGRDKIGVRWPGKLRVSVLGNQASLSSGNWYLVSGVLSVSQDDPLSTQLVADTVYACKQAKCAEAADPTAIVDHKLAAMGVTQ